MHSRRLSLAISRDQLHADHPNHSSHSKNLANVDSACQLLLRGRPRLVLAWTPYDDRTEPGFWGLGEFERKEDDTNMTYAKEEASRFGSGGILSLGLVWS